MMKVSRLNNKQIKRVATFAILIITICSALFAEDVMVVRMKDGRGTKYYPVSEIDSVDYEDKSVWVKDGELIKASFKVSDTRRVRFSQGNLQYCAGYGKTHKTSDGFAQGTWRFAQNQYDVIEDGNKYVDSTYIGWIDLFSWGTSGWNSGAISYQPWAYPHNNASFYLPGGSDSTDLTGEYANADWGVYNAISNGGNEPEMWRTLTADEWKYLIENNRYEKTEIEGKMCFIIIPENFPSVVKIQESYTSEQFSMIEKMGVVALPIPCTRGDLKQMIYCDKLGAYWSSSHHGYNEFGKRTSAFAYSFNPYGFVIDSLRGASLSVRLVRNFTLDIQFVDYDGKLLLDTIVERGDMPTYTRWTPKKDSTKVYAYTFRSWSDGISSANKDMVYTAIYDSAKILYTSIFKDYNDKVLVTIPNCVYDSITKFVPFRDSTYSFRTWKSDESKIDKDTLMYMATYDTCIFKRDGAIRMAYKVSDSTYVYFSQGNLQYNAMQGTHITVDSTEKGTWRFAENQYDCIGSDNRFISPNYDGWIDLFGWGTSGWNSGMKAYQPWATSKVNSDYLYSDLTGSHAVADWGVYNAISNGGNMPNKWRTLTDGEYDYLYDNNKWALGYIKTSEKDSNLCFLLLPDGFVEPLEVNVSICRDKGKQFTMSYNTYTTEQFKSLEKLGVVAFPACGYRDSTGYGKIRDYNHYYGSYFTANYYNYYSKSGTHFIGPYVFGLGMLSGCSGLYSGRSVRLVQDLALNIHFVNCDGTLLLDTIVPREENPVYTRGIPKKDSTSIYAYTFKGWVKDTVSSDITYTAVYDSTKILYTSVLKNYNDTTLAVSQNCAYDSILAYIPFRDSAHTFRTWTRNEDKIDKDTLIYTAVYDTCILKRDGAICMAYKVSDSTFVYFSQGNLQFNAMLGLHETADSVTRGTWRFAENQYDVIGDANEYIDSIYNGWIDLFGWGTSGWNSGATCYQPWSKSKIYSDYYPGGGKYNDMTDTYAKSDWGVYNAISNGGNESNKWRTLTRLEWQYLLENNKWTLGYIKTTDKDSILCYFLIPEGFTEPSGVKVAVISTSLSPSFVRVNNDVCFSNISTSSYVDNSYTIEQFASLEKLGVVALPCGGYRNGTARYDVGLYGYCWSSSAMSISAWTSRRAYIFGFGSECVFADGFLTDTTSFRCNGLSVRLVQDLTRNVHFINYDGTHLLDTVVSRDVTPIYTREAPKKDSTNTHAYTFKEWKKTTISNDITYTAVYDSTEILYISVLKDYNDTTFAIYSDCIYDSIPTFVPFRDSSHSFRTWIRNEDKIDKDTLVYTAVYDTCILKRDGAICMAYKVSNTTSVYFSQGNLQYNAAQGTHITADSITQGTWRFAENQYDIVGDSNKYIDSTYTDWIDLFCWGTSGWNSGAKVYQPWSISKEKSDYYPGESFRNSLTDIYAKADWGVYNAISNGGNELNKWRTLTTEEWQYLFKNTQWTLGYIKTSEVDSSLCYFLLPDGFVAPIGIKVAVVSISLSLTDGYVNNIKTSSYAGNTYTIDQFKSLEKLGVVALPCDGYRYGTDMYKVKLSGNYWSASADGSYNAGGFDFGSTSVYSSDASHNRASGLSVRLVQDY